VDITLTNKEARTAHPCSDPGKTYMWLENGVCGDHRAWFSAMTRTTWLNNCLRPTCCDLNACNIWTC